MYSKHAVLIQQNLPCSQTPCYHTKAHWWLPHNQYWTIPSFPGHLLLFFLITYMTFSSIFLTEYLTFSKVTCGQQNRVWDDLGMRLVEPSLLIMSLLMKRVLHVVGYLLYTFGWDESMGAGMTVRTSSKFDWWSQLAVELAKWLILPLSRVYMSLDVFARWRWESTFSLHVQYMIGSVWSLGLDGVACIF